MRTSRYSAAAVAVAAVLVSSCGTEGITDRSAASPAAPEFASWGKPTNAEALEGTSSELNTGFLDGCPIHSPDGLSLYMASNRSNGTGGLDIWVADRKRNDGPWGTPKNLGAPVNSDADDFCPTPVRNGLYFVSARQGGCGGPDIYFARRDANGRLAAPKNLGCEVDGGPNSAAGEASPSYVVEDRRVVLYFSSGRPGGVAEDGSTPDSDINVSERGRGGKFTTARLVPGLNTEGDDSRPNVRRDGLEIFFDRSAKIGGPADIYSATRASTSEDWSAPFKLDAPVNTPANESRASLSWDGRTLVFGSTRPGSESDPATGDPSNDIYFTRRDRLRKR